MISALRSPADGSRHCPEYVPALPKYTRDRSGPTVYSPRCLLHALGVRTEAGDVSQRKGCKDWSRIQEKASPSAWLTNNCVGLSPDRCKSPTQSCSEVCIKPACPALQMPWLSHFRVLVYISMLSSQHVLFASSTFETYNIYPDLPFHHWSLWLFLSSFEFCPRILWVLLSSVVLSSRACL
jgi:hypothetical protein